MKPWTVDADDIRIASDLDDKLVHRTPSIHDFLRQRSDKFIVTATKGFGKTLLLKAQRIAYEEKGVRCLPENNLIDKPVGDRVFSDAMLRLYSTSTENWRRVWLISMATATLKALHLTEDLSVNSRLAGLLDDHHLKGVIDHFVQVLGFRRNDLYRSADDADALLLPRLRDLQMPVAIFIDSIDEYFKKHLLALTASDTGELDRGVWYFSQMGLVEAAYQLRRICHHLKVYAAVRKEAFERFNETTEMVQQYRGSVIDLTYRPESLEKIFLNNIRHERKLNLVMPAKHKSDPLTAFLGISELTHSYTGEMELVFHYIYRHTLGRPRDLMTIGQKLSDLAPEERSEVTIKRAVNLAATDIAHEYLNEIRPYMGSIDIEDILSRLPSNVVSPATVKTIFEPHPVHLEGFGVLCTAGLVGVVSVDPVTSEKVQRFTVPGESRLDHDAVLPPSSHYLVNPILTQIISLLNPGYVNNIDRTNVIGRDRPWRELDPDRRLSVLKGDIEKFGELMDNGLEETVREAFHDIAMSHVRGCVHCEVTDGDALTIVHSEPGALVKAAKRIMEDLYEVSGHPRLRMAIDFGPVRLRHNTDQRVIASGQPFLRAARIEPHVPPNPIWVTEAFKQELEKTDSLYHAVPVEPSTEMSDPDEPGHINVKKPGSDSRDQWLTVYEVEEKRF